MLFQSCQEIPWQDWHAVIPSGNTLWTQDFLLAIEQCSPPQVTPYYVLVYEYGRPIFCAYFQQISFHTHQIKNFTQNLSSNASVKDWAFLQLSNVARKLVQLFQFRLLVNGNPMLTGETGFQTVPDVAVARQKELLSLAIDTVSAQTPRSIGVLIKDVFLEEGADQWDQFWQQKSYHKFLPDPEMHISIRPDWQEWDDYLGAMSSKYRQRAKSAYKRSKDIVNRELSIEDLYRYREELYALFQQVVAGEKFSLCEVPVNFLHQLKSVLKEQFLVQGYFLDDQLIGFTSLIQSEARPISHFIGFETQLNQPKKLYQRMLYDQVQMNLGT